jgi:hypothetical protein
MHLQYGLGRLSLPVEQTNSVLLSAYCGVSLESPRCQLSGKPAAAFSKQVLQKSYVSMQAQILVPNLGPWQVKVIFDVQL